MHVLIIEYFIFPYSSTGYMCVHMFRTMPTCPIKSTDLIKDQALYRILKNSKYTFMRIIGHQCRVKSSLT